MICGGGIRSTGRYQARTLHSLTAKEEHNSSQETGSHTQYAHNPLLETSSSLAIMRIYDMPSAVVFLIAAFLSPPISATPVQLDNQTPSLENLQDVEKRCSNPCGYYGQVCCESGEVCYTDSNNQAQCGVGSGGGQTAAQLVPYLTSTYVLTDESTYTTTFYSSMAAVATPASGCALTCGGICCQSGQFCNSNWQCANIGGSSVSYNSLYTVTTYTTATASATAGAPLRPTSSTITTVTYTGSATTTQPYSTPVGTSGIILGASASSTGGGLSGGAIAGIVIGVILGILLLLLLCLCCCAKGILDTILGIFGLGSRSRRRTEETEVIEEHRHSGGGGRTWFGASRPSRRTEVVEKKSGGWGGLAGVAAALGGLAVLLKLKRDRAERNEKSSYGYGSDYYSTEYTGTSASEF